MSGNSIYEIDFEYWSVLASTDPQKFEQLRQDQITAIIERASSQRQQRRLRGLQWRIDLIREQHKDSAMAACIAISELMWETFEQLAELLQQSTTECGTSAPVPSIQGNIIPFPSKSRS
ncbi:MAG: DUF3135 domain-containing protein [Gammaproteobacteria bacterium]|nr:DUF3135 domain-containing protein [Gammaproteobacteria bacterium]